MSLPLSAALNTSQQLDVLIVLHDFTTAVVVPMVLLESFLFGACTGGVLIGSYMLCSKKEARIAVSLLLWSLYAVFVACWVLSLRVLSHLLTGSAVGLSLTLAQVQDLEMVSIGLSSGVMIFNTDSIAWPLLPPLITETTLLGLATVLLAVTLYTTFKQGYGLSRWRSFSVLFAPVTAAIMYALSLSHWAAFLAIYLVQTSGALLTNNSFDTDTLSPLVFAILMINITLSDIIVLWRMCIVWDKARFTVVLSSVFTVTTFALGIVNLATLAGYEDVDNSETVSELVPTFGQSAVGLAAAFMSLASNMCATALVSRKVWLYRKQSKTRKSLRSEAMLLGGVMELIIDSGVVYTVIWILYLASFFAPISSTYVTPEGFDNNSIVAVDYLNAAMAQLTTIYPLAIFILVALSKERRARAAPRLLPMEANTFEPRALEFEYEAEQDIMLKSGIKNDTIPLNVACEVKASRKSEDSW